MNDFVSVAEIASIPPGHGRTVQLNGHEFAVWNVDGEFFCIDDECPHRGGPLGAGLLQDVTVFCPLHGWGFDVRTGICDTRPDRPVRTYRTRVVDGWVQICPSSDG
jgi:nitrite reductase/ring-hydroxylating ferredoxin subunit